MGMFTLSYLFPFPLQKSKGKSERILVRMVRRSTGMILSQILETDKTDTVPISPVF